MKNNTAEVKLVIKKANELSRKINPEYRVFSKPFSAKIPNEKILGNMWFEGYGTDEEMREEISNFLKDSNINVEPENVKILPLNLSPFEN